FFFQAEDGIRDRNVTGVQTCALPIFARRCSHRDPDRCDAHYEIARRTAPCAWPSATTNRRSPLKGTSRSQPPISEGAANSIIRCVARAPRSQWRSEWATSRDERSRNREARAQNSVPVGGVL